MMTDTAPQTVEINHIYDLMHRLGVTANYIGFFHASYAVYLALQQRERLTLVTKWLYPDVARHYQTTWQCVERNIRTVSGIAWLKNRALLETLAHHPLPHKPSVSVFLSILTSYFTSTLPDS